MKNPMKTDDELRIFRRARKLTPYRSAVRITLAYLTFGILWILTTDSILDFLFGNSDTYQQLQTYKGWFYVIITAVFIFLLVVSTLDLYEDAKKNVEAVNVDLQNQLEKTQLSEQRFEMAVKGSFDSIWEFDNHTKTYYMSETLLRNLGYETLTLKNIDDWRALIDPQDLPYFDQRIDAFSASPEPDLEWIYRVKRYDGTIAWIRTHGTANIDSEGKLLKIAGSHTDITEAKEHQEKLQRLAYYNDLTGLLNWHGFANVIQRRILDDPDLPFTLLYLDIDDFKNFNDVHGYAVGDKLLREIACDLTGLAQKDEVVANLGGDGFGLLVETIDRAQVHKRIEKVFGALKKAHTIDGQKFSVFASVGIAQYPKDDEQFEDLMQCADEAMYEAKTRGKNTSVFFSDEIHATRLNTISLTNDLRHAIENKELYLMFQPIYRLNDHRLASMEALVRWKPAGHPAVPPDVFIPLAESTGLISSIELWVFEQVFAQVVKWRSIRTHSVPIAINLSSRGIADDEFIQKVLHLLRKYEIKDGEIEIEITETGLIERYETALHNLRRLRVNGIKILLDDFGKGYSSLTYLVNLPIDVLKIDRGFTSRIHSSVEIDAVIATIVSLAHSIQLKVVAEGIEYENQFDYLLSLGTDFGQGYFLHLPALPEVVEKLLKQ